MQFDIMLHSFRSGTVTKPNGFVGSSLANPALICREEIDKFRQRIQA